MLLDSGGGKWVVVKRVGVYMIARAIQGGAVIVLIRLADGALRVVMELVK